MTGLPPTSATAFVVLPEHEDGAALSIAIVLAIVERTKTVFCHDSPKTSVCVAVAIVADEAAAVSVPPE
jgi:hypothetical protein